MATQQMMTEIIHLVKSMLQNSYEYRAKCRN